MDSELRGTRIFHRYHRARHNRDETCYREEDVSGTIGYPTRKAALRPRSKTASFKTNASDVDRGVQTVENERIRDDLTLGYACHRHHFTTERNPTEDESSANSEKSFRIKSLDGWYEETVSPLCTDSESAASSHKIHDVHIPKIHLPPSRVAYRKRDSNLHKSLVKAKTKLAAETSDNDLCSEDRQGKIKIAPPSMARRRRSSHNRSQFVFDGNLSFGSMDPNPMFASSPSLMSSSPQRTSYPSPQMMDYPTPATPLSMTPMTSLSMTPMTPLSMTPPTQTLNSNGFINPEQQQKQGRRTPPPTHRVQRSRNKAMLSIHYQTLVFDKMSPQQIQQNQLGRARLSRQHTW